MTLDRGQLFRFFDTRTKDFRLVIRLETRVEDYSSG